MNEAEQILTRLYNLAKCGVPHGLNKETKHLMDVLIDACESSKGVLAVYLTLALKKEMTPEQDIRNHQSSMQGGFSARGLDAKHVTPFLKNKNFPHMVSGAGALTRSLEQALPYDLNYPGKISPSSVRDAFLKCVNSIQNGNCNPQDAMQYLFCGLILHRDRDKNLKLIKPKNRSIAVAVENIGKHFDGAKKGGLHLPALALYAVYKQMISEVGKYKGYRLCDLQSHTAADLKTGFLGDIQVNDSNGRPVEAVEVKHGILLTPKLVMDCYERFKTVPGVRTYYLLSTNEKIDKMADISEITMKIHRDHGCQVIVNGIQGTLRYYLRLVSSTDNFLDDYVELVERECNYEIKMLWNTLWDNGV